MIERIEKDNQIYAIIIRREFEKEGIEFFTPTDFSQQIAYMKREEGYRIQPHLHNEVKREVLITKEVLFIKSGKVLVDFYTNEKQYFLSKTLNVGDVILLAYGGHGFKMLETSEIIEVKQGPYSGEEDKVRFEPKEK